MSSAKAIKSKEKPCGSEGSDRTENACAKPVYNTKGLKLSVSIQLHTCQQNQVNKPTDVFFPQVLFLASPGLLLITISFLL